MARSALQLLMRREKAKGNNLKQEIDDLAGQGKLPPIVREWAHDVRELGNEVAHPEPGAKGVSEKDARDVVRFLRVLLNLLLDMPEDIKEYRGRRTKKA